MKYGRTRDYFTASPCSEDEVFNILFRELPLQNLQICCHHLRGTDTHFDCKESSKNYPAILQFPKAQTQEPQLVGRC